VALDAATGAIRWTREFPPEPPNNRGQCYRGVVRADDLVIGVSKDMHLYAMDRLTGELRWTAAPPGGLVPIRTIDTILVAGSAEGFLTGFDARTGKQLWRNTANWGSLIDPLAADSQRVYGSHAGGVLAAFDLKTGTVLWTLGTGGEVEFLYAPAVDADRLYIGGTGGFYALKKD
jgi:outer membrane protein assembly factor BamB